MEMGYMIAEWLGRGDGCTSPSRENGPLFDPGTLSVMEIENVQAAASITNGPVSLHSISVY